MFMPCQCQDHEKEDAAPLPPGFSTQTKAYHNDGAGHGGPDAEGTESKVEIREVDGQEAQAQWLPQSHCCQGVGHKKRINIGFHANQFLKSTLS